MTHILPIERIEKCILLIRGHKVILDSTLAELYGVPTKRLNEQVRRNSKRFPEDFMFELTQEEIALLRSQNATSSSVHGGRRYMPFVFTEHGAIMAANVLHSDQAVEVSLLVVRAFVKLRQSALSNEALSRQLAQLERKIGTHDQAIRSLFDTIRQMMSPPEAKKRRIGFINN